MKLTILFKYVGTALLGAAGLCVALVSCASPNVTKADVARYEAALGEHPAPALAPGSAEEKAAIQRVSNFLAHAGDAAYLRENTSKVYAPNAYFNDTLKATRGAPAIEAHFLKTSEAMTSYSARVEDVAHSGADYYFRWVLIYRSPALRGGEEIQSIGISQMRFNAEGQVVLHQDFWDSTSGFFEHAPVAGGVIGLIKKRL